jgi:hypothetical protein
VSRDGSTLLVSDRLDFHGFIGAGQFCDPVGVCANADVVVVARVLSCFVDSGARAVVTAS